MKYTFVIFLIGIISIRCSKEEEPQAEFYMRNNSPSKNIVLNDPINDINIKEYGPGSGPHCIYAYTFDTINCTNISSEASHFEWYLKDSLISKEKNISIIFDPKLAFDESYTINDTLNFYKKLYPITLKAISKSGKNYNEVTYLILELK